MTANITPTIISSKLFLGVVPSTQLGNVAWNDDGQCLFLTKRGATVMTPWLVSSMPSPPTLIDPNMLNDKNKEDGEEDDEAMDGTEEREPKSKPEVTRPEGGEVKWWSNDIEIQATGPRDERYNWVGVTDGTSWLLRNDEVNPRQAVWSHSGLSDLGGSLLAMLSSTGQLSIYAPRSDPISQQWDEIADITYLIKTHLRPQIPRDEKPSLAQVRELQATCIAWSPALPLDSYPGSDGSLLAVATRSCGISLWSFGEEKRFKRVAHLKIGNIFASHLAWSTWTAVDERTCQARLVYVTTEGYIGSYTIRRTTHTQDGATRSLDCVIDGPVCIDVGDGRQVTALQWIDGTLFWTKPGSAHFYSSQEDTKTIRLGQVGNWAGCNALGVCVGVHRGGPTSIAVVLSTLTIHIIHNIHTTPTLAPLEESLVATLAARQAFLDHAHGDYQIRNRFLVGPIVPEQLTAWTSGWAGLGQEGIACLNFEVINFHNLSTSNEGKRLVSFSAVDITKSLPGPHLTVIEQLRNLLDAPVNPLLRSTSFELMPHVMRLVATTPTPSEISDLLDICSPDDEAGSEHPNSGGDMRQAFFNREDLNASRLKYALALWCAGRYPANKTEFADAATSSLRSTMASNLRVAVEFASRNDRVVASGSMNDRYLRLLITRSQRLKVTSDAISRKLPSSDEQEEIDKCRACKLPVDMGDILGIAKCRNGHHWSRCSITGFLITSPRYRTCTTCPAIALLPSRISDAPPRPVDPFTGSDRDYKRFLEGVRAGEELIQEVLESCGACIMCGGRWIRST